MNKIKIFLFFGSLFYLTSFGQTKPDTLRLLYGINEVQSETNSQRIDSLVKALNGKIIKLKIYGYADFLHSVPYNQRLSQKRANAVKARLIEKTSPSQINSIICKGLGEKFSND